MEGLRDLAEGLVGPGGGRVRQELRVGVFVHRCHRSVRFDRAGGGTPVGWRTVRDVSYPEGGVGVPKDAPPNKGGASASSAYIGGNFGGCTFATEECDHFFGVVLGPKTLPRNAKTEGTPGGQGVMERRALPPLGLSPGLCRTEQETQHDGTCTLLSWEPRRRAAAAARRMCRHRRPRLTDAAARSMAQPTASRLLVLTAARLHPPCRTPRAFFCAAGQQDAARQEDARQEAEAEPRHPGLDPHAHWQHHPVRAAAAAAPPDGPLCPLCVGAAAVYAPEPAACCSSPSRLYA